MCKTNVQMPATPAAPTPIDPGKSALDYIKAMADPVLQQQLLDAERQFRPQYNQLEQNDIEQFLTGGQGFTKGQFDAGAYFNSQDPSMRAQIEAEAARTGRSVNQWVTDHVNEQARAGDPNSINALRNFTPTETGGTLGLYAQAVPFLANLEAQTQSSQRAADIQDVQRMGAQAGEAFRAANPQLQEALSQATAMGGASQNYAGLQGALDGTQQFGDVGYDRVNAGQVGSGALGDSLYQQALGASGLGSVGQALQGRAGELAQSRGQLNADELRQLQQDVRAGYGSRGVLDSGQAISGEALARLTNQRERMMQDLGVASSLNQAGQAELNANRGFATGVQGMDLGRQAQNAALGLQAGMANQATGLQAGLQNRQFSAAQQQQNIQNQALLGQMLQGQQGQDRSYALSLAQAQQGAASDPFMAILGRQGQAFGAGQGAAQFSAGLAGQQMGPNLFDPNAGVNLALGQNANLANYNANIYGSQASMAGAQAGAQGSMLGGLFGAAGSVLGGPLGGMLGSGIGKLFSCWVAREVYGKDNPKWLEFREWLLTKSPEWFYQAYIKYGPRFAEWLKNKPRLKSVIRFWMDGRIKTMRRIKARKAGELS